MQSIRFPFERKLCLENLAAVRRANILMKDLMGTHRIGKFYA